MKYKGIQNVLSFQPLAASHLLKVQQKENVPMSLQKFPPNKSLSQTGI